MDGILQHFMTVPMGDRVWFPIGFDVNLGSTLRNWALGSPSLFFCGKNRTYHFVVISAHALSFFQNDTRYLSALSSAISGYQQWFWTDFQMVK